MDYGIYIVWFSNSYGQISLECYFEKRSEAEAYCTQQQKHYKLGDRQYNVDHIYKYDVNEGE